MNIETLLYSYLAICTAMIIFNIITAVVLRAKDNRIVHVSNEFKKRILEQIPLTAEGKDIEERHKDYMARKLRKVENMIAFDKILEELYADDPVSADGYLSRLGSVIASLALMYGGRDCIEAAYFPYIIKKYKLIYNNSLPEITDMLIHLLSEPSLYCRENAMQALYTSGDCGCIIKALKIIDKSDMFFHGKLISDGLLTFTGDHNELAEQIKADFESFSVQMRVSLLNFFRFDSGNQCEFIYSLLCDDTQDNEIRYACIRYFGKYHYGPAYAKLLALGDYKNGLTWEYSAIASYALAIYPGEQTVELLKNNLRSPNWYVRYNSSLSLDRLGLTYIELIDIIEGSDRYASEILRYRFELRNLSEKEAVSQ